MVRRLLLLSMLALGVGGCSLTLDFQECTSNADCEALAGGGESLVCSLNGFCVEGDDENNDPNNDVNNDVNNTPNNDVNNDVGCTRNSECAAQGANFICNPQGACVSALSEECFAVEGPINEDDIFIIGSVMPTRGNNASKGIPREQAIRLAVAEFNQNGGLGNGRRLVHIGCDDDGNAEQGKRAAEHLANVVGVSAIIGPAFSGVYTDVSDQVTSRAGVMIISPSATSASITTLDDNGLSWRTVPSDVFQGVAMADRVRDLRAEGGNLPIKVAALGKDDAYGNGLLNKLTEELAVELGDGNFAGSVYNPNQDLATPVINIVNSLGEADYVLLFGTNETVTLIQNYERQVLEGGLTPPVYILSDGGQSAELLAYVEANPGIIDRIEGVAPDGKNGGLYTAYALRFRNRYQVDPGSFSANAYDATYLLAYAVISLTPDPRPSGAAIAEAMGRLITGNAIEAGPNKIGEARNTLLSGNPIDYIGASGPLQFDLETGDVAANISLWRVVEDVVDDYAFEDVALYVIDDDGLSGQWGPNVD